jgi:hypothetical protein
VTLPQPGQWVRVRHACPDVTHDEPVEVTGVHSGRIWTRRCDGIPMTLVINEDGTPVFGDEWEVVT